MTHFSAPAVCPHWLTEERTLQGVQTAFYLCLSEIIIILHDQGVGLGWSDPGRSQFPSEKWKQDSCRPGSRSQVSIQNLNIIQYSSISFIKLKEKFTALRHTWVGDSGLDTKNYEHCAGGWEVHHYVIKWWWCVYDAMTWCLYVTKNKSVITGMHSICSWCMSIHEEVQFLGKYKNASPGYFSSEDAMLTIAGWCDGAVKCNFLMQKN